MRTRVGLIRRAVILAVAPWLAAAQSPPAAFSRPTLGYVFDASSNTVKVMAGIPGAAALGSAFSWSGDLTISPRNRFGLGLSGGLSLQDWSSGKLVSRQLRGDDESPSQLAFSPTGRTAIVLFRSSGKLRIWSGLPDAATLESDVDVKIEDGVTSLAVADDARTGAVLLNGKLMRLGGDGALWPVDAAATYSAMAFRPGTRELAVADAENNRVLLFGDFAGGSGATVIAADLANPAAVSFSADGNLLVAATHANESIVTIDMRARTSVRFACACRPEGLYPVAGNAVFRLSESTKGNIALFDGDGEAPRIVLVAAPADGGAQ